MEAVLGALVGFAVGALVAWRYYRKRRAQVDIALGQSPLVRQ